MLKPVPLTVEEAARVVNDPANGVVTPMVMLLIEPAVPEEIVIVPVLVVVYDWLFVVVLIVIAPVAVSAVNDPAKGVDDPMMTLLI